jgi:hypothetical protein
MGIEHSEVKEGPEIARCPTCDYITTRVVGGVFYCTNPLCDVEQLPKILAISDHGDIYE